MAAIRESKVLGPQHPMASEEMLTLARAVADALRDELRQDVPAAVKGQFDAYLAKEIAAEVARLVELQNVPGVVRMQLKSYEEGVALLVGRLVEKHLAERVAEMRAFYEGRLGEEAKAFRALLEGAVKGFEAGLASVHETVKSLPVPQVTTVIPEKAIEVKQLPSVVHLPKDAIVVKSEAPTVNFSVPEGSIKAVTPPRKSVTVKDVLYTPDGRPGRIVETVHESDLDKAEDATE